MVPLPPPTRTKELLEPRCVQDNFKVIISKTVKTFILREIKDSNKLSVVLVQRKNSGVPKDGCVLFGEPYAW